MAKQEGAAVILAVDDDEDVLKRIERLVRFEGLGSFLPCSRPREALALAERSEASVLVLDLLMPEMDGRELLGLLKERLPELPIIVATAVNDLDSAIACMRAGAFDYVPKTAESSRLVASIRHALSIRELQSDYRALKATLLEPRRPSSGAFSAIVTRDERMISALRYVETIARSAKPILITGESGTGKELVAQAVHVASGRTGELVTLNIAGLDDAMFSDTLFGHKRGAYTGADADRGGLIERAEGGTLFLDEIGDLSPQSQVKLLRLIEDKRYYPLGADLPRATTASIVAATNVDLRAVRESGSFRADLFFRLQTHLVMLPPLRERPDDIPLLVEHFLAKACEKFQKRPMGLPKELWPLLSIYAFPGNVRELESMVFDAVGRSGGSMLGLDAFRERILASSARKLPAPSEADGGNPLKGWASLPTLRELNGFAYEEAMRRAGGNQGLAAALLGISRTALNRRLKTSSDDDD